MEWYVWALIGVGFFFIGGLKIAIFNKWLQNRKNKPNFKDEE